MSREEHPHQELTEKIIGLAMKVHRALGPGLLESAYEACLAFELEEAGFEVRRQVPVDLLYADRLRVESAYRMDLVVNGTLVLELKTVEKIIPAHEAQVFTYLRFSKLPVALILNFWAWPLKEGGIKRVLLPQP
ncbi:MAG TPA: GxxExxY protein [Holophagaceae bacterium]|nr:GxxExxY protein [Holophagaceae bacterium]